jgi:hypothetical protein
MPDGVQCNAHVSVEDALINLHVDFFFRALAYRLLNFLSSVLLFGPDRRVTEIDGTVSRYAYGHRVFSCGARHSNRRLTYWEMRRETTVCTVALSPSQ